MAIVKASDAKKYSGLYRYYSNSDKQKITKGYYLKYRDEFGNSPMLKLSATTIEGALIEANTIRNESRQKKVEFKQDTKALQRAKETNNLTLDQVCKEYFDGRGDMKNNDQDMAVYKSRVSNVIGKELIKSVDLEMMKSLQGDLKWRFAPKTVNNTIALMMGIFTFAEDAGYIVKVPISRRSNKKTSYLEKVEESIESGRVLTQTELDLLFRSLEQGTDTFAPNPRLYLFCKILYYTGVRPAAAIALKVDDYDTVKHRLKFKAMKKAKAFNQDMHDDLIPLIDAYIEAHKLKSGESIFYPVQTFKRTETGRDKPSVLRGFTRRMKVINDELFNEGVLNPRKKVTFYSLRRTSATRVYKSKGLIEASKFLHHTDVRTTSKYLNIDDELKGAINDAL